MIVDILFVLVIVAILLVIYKMKFSRPKDQIIRQQIIQVRQKQQKTNNNNNNSNNNDNNNNNAQNQYTGQDESSGEDSDQGQLSTKKQLYKQQKRRQKQQKKQAREQFLQQQKKKRQEYQKNEQEREKIEQEKRKKEEQYIQTMREEERKRKEDQFNKWKNMFTVEESGKNVQSADLAAKKQKQFQNNFINYLTSKKLTQLEDLSHKFGMPTKQLVQKIKNLQKQQKLSGVFDQRGKYLYIQQKQWDAVKNYILAKGRIKKTDIMNECAKIIKIPDDQDEDLINLISEVVESN